MAQNREKIVYGGPYVINGTNSRDGYINLYRSIQRHWVWDNPLYYKAWSYCLMRANFKETTVPFNGRPIKVKRGEFITSREHFSNNTGLSIQETRTFWKRLEKERMIAVNSTKLATRITVCNYDAYQGGQPGNQPSSNQLSTTEKNVKNDNNIIKGENFSKPTPEMITAYCLEQGYNLDGDFIFKYYETRGWKDKNGNPGLNWKQKIQRVWYKPQNKLAKSVPLKVNLYEPTD